MSKSDLTAVLHAVRDGDTQAEQVLFERVYDELRRLAHHRLRHESARPTLIQTTDLVNEAYLRLVRVEPANWENRRHFFGAAIEAMRRILIEYARRRKAQRHGGGQTRITFSEQIAADAPAFEILALNDALDRLAVVRPRAAQVVGYLFFLGLTIPESAQLLGVAPRTVDSDWRFANAWLRREIATTIHDE